MLAQRDNWANAGMDAAPASHVTVRCDEAGGTLEFSLRDDGIAELRKCSVQGEMVTVPAVVEGCAVTAVGYKAFDGLARLRRVVLPDSVATVGAYAFMRSGLEEFSAPASLRVIGEKAFHLCANLRKVTLSEGLESIGVQAFPPSVTYVRVPSTVCEIGQGALAFPEVSSQSPHYASDGCGGLYRKTSDGLVFAELTAREAFRFAIARGTVAIGPEAFRRCGNLESVVIPDGVRHIGVRAFEGCLRLRRAPFPDSLVSVGDEAFKNTSLEAVRLPAGFDDLGINALFTSGDLLQSKRPSLKSVTVHPDCKRFFVENSILCERVDGRRNYVEDALIADRNAGVSSEMRAVGVFDASGEAEYLHRCKEVGEHVRAVMFFGEGSVIDVPRQVDALGTNAFSFVRGVETLVLHEGIRVVEPGFAVSDIIPHIRVLLDKPQFGRDAVDVMMPKKFRGMPYQTWAFLRQATNLEYLFQYADERIVCASTVYNKALLMLWRLRDPLFLTEKRRAAYCKNLMSSIRDVSRAFLDAHYMEGFYHLAELGILDEDSLTELIDQANDERDSLTTGFLLNVKHRVFGAPLVDLRL